MFRPSSAIFKEVFDKEKEKQNSYITADTPHLGYKNQSVNLVQGKYTV
jgi:hypothetical protein